MSVTASSQNEMGNFAENAKVTMLKCVDNLITHVLCLCVLGVGGGATEAVLQGKCCNLS